MYVRASRHTSQEAAIPFKDALGLSLATLALAITRLWRRRSMRLWHILICWLSLAFAGGLSGILVSQVHKTYPGAYLAFILLNCSVLGLYEVCIGRIMLLIYWCWSCWTYPAECYLPNGWFSLHWGIGFHRSFDDCWICAMVWTNLTLFDLAADVTIVTSRLSPHGSGKPYSSLVTDYYIFWRPFVASSLSRNLQAQVSDVCFGPWESMLFRVHLYFLHSRESVGPACLGKSVH